MKQIGLLLLVITWFLWVHHSVAEDARGPVVIAISRVYGYGSIPVGVLHNQIVSDLVTRYNCCVLARSKLYDIAVEDAIHDLSAIRTNGVACDQIPAADYAISIKLHYSYETGWAGVVRWIDNQDGARQKTAAKAEFAAKSLSDLSERASEAIAKALSLPVRGDTAHLPAQNIAGRTWAVLPFLRYEAICNSRGITLRNIKSDDKLPEQVELALQKSKPDLKLVDRTRLDSVLAEHKVTSLVGRDYTGLAGFARLAGADCVLVGAVAKWEKVLRLDMYLVDVRTAGIFGAQTAVCDSEDKLNALIEAEIVKFAGKNLNAITVGSSSKEQRLREAEFYLDIYDLVSSYSSHEVFYGKDESAFQAQENAESAYVLACDNPVMVYRSAEIMSDLLETHNHRMRGYISKTISQRAANVINRILETVRYTDLSESSGYTPGGRFGVGFVPLLLRAEALMFLGQNQDALRLAEEHYQTYPGIQPGRALWVMAKCQLAMGQVAKAQELCRQMGEKYEHNDDYRELLSVLASEGRDDKAIFEAVQKKVLAKERISNVKEWETYLDMLVKLEGPEKALAEIQKWCINRWGLAETPFEGRFYAWLAEARCYLLLNDKESAVRRCKDIIFLAKQAPMGAPKNVGDTYNKVCTQAAAMISAIEASIGKVHELWKTASEIHPLPSVYKIYFVPVDDFPLEPVAKQAAAAASFFRGESRVLPPIKMKDKLAGIPKREDFFLDDDAYYAAAVKELIIPDDAIMIQMVSNQGSLRHWPISSNNGNPLLFVEPRVSAILKFDDRPACHQHDITRTLILGFCYKLWPKKTTHGSFFQRFPFEVAECEHRPCIAAKLLNSSYVMDVRNAFCPECQEKYKKADFDKIHNDLMDYLKKAGARIVKAGTQNNE